jgi:hypothetical protein
MQLADMTGDGLRDLVMFEPRSPTTLAVYAHDGATGFETTAVRHEMPDLESTRYFTIGDANGDGLKDIVVAPSLVFSPTRALLQDADGGFTPGPALGMGDDLVRFAPMNWDGREDLLAIDTSEGKVRVWMQGPLGLQQADSRSFGLPSFSAGSVLEMLAVGDLNSDACPDVVAARYGLIVVFYATDCGL